MLTRKNLMETHHNDKLVFAGDRLLKSMSACKHSYSSMKNDFPSFYSGITSLLNITGEKRFSDYMKGNDADDLRRDWIAVGNDIRKSMKQFRKK